jgi:hypothetical protein
LDAFWMLARRDGEWISMRPRFHERTSRSHFFSSLSHAANVPVFTAHLFLGRSSYACFSKFTWRRAATKVEQLLLTKQGH